VSPSARVVPFVVASQPVMSKAAAAPAITLLERSFPFRELSMLVEADRRGRDPSYGLHRWWARRPPALVRGILLAAFAPASQSLATFWHHFGNSAPQLTGFRVHDPFLGGGSTLLEAARLGAAASGTDVDPLACMIARHELDRPSPIALRHYGLQLADHLISSTGHLYSSARPRWTPLHWFWIPVVTCPHCQARSALYRTLVIARDIKKVGAVVRDAAQTAFCPDCFSIQLLSSPTARILDCCGRHRLDESTFYSNRFHCSVCGGSADHSALQTLKAGLRLLAVEETHPIHRRRIRAPRSEDKRRVALARQYVIDNASDLTIPNTQVEVERRDSRPVSYGAERHRDLFHPRQLATFGTAMTWIARCDANAAIKEALMLATSHTLAFNNRLCGYATDYGRLAPLFSVRSYSLPALAVELNPLHPTAGRGTLVRSLRDRLPKDVSRVTRATWDYNAARTAETAFSFSTTPQIDIKCASALDSQSSEDVIDFSFFDPPYFDYIAYSELSEFFRAWLGCGGIGGAPLLPDPSDPVNSFARCFASAIQALRKRLRHGAPIAFTFHSSSVEAWSAIAHALRIASERVTAAWPVLADPHMGHHGSKGACEWDLVLVCRPDSLCRPRRAPSIGRWRQRLRPLVVRPADQAAFRIAMTMLRASFGSLKVESSAD
jgi:putative DNA methylase